MEPRILLALCGLAYRDPPENARMRLDRGESVPVREMCQELLRLNDAGELSCGKLAQWEWETFSKLIRTDIVVTHFVDKNRESGFVGMAFRDPNGRVVAAMRGSENSTVCAPTDIDWVDNFAAPFAVSVQYRDALAFADLFPEGNLTLIGHSKGGNNALFALAMAQNPSAWATVFNAQGFACDFWGAAKKRRLRQRGINYVVADDLVGALLCHPENRIFVEGVKGVNPHAPEAYVFDAAGYPVTASRTLRSRTAEIASRALLPLLKKVKESPVFRR